MHLLKQCAFAAFKRSVTVLRIHQRHQIPNLKHFGNLIALVAQRRDLIELTLLSINGGQALQAEHYPRLNDGKIWNYYLSRGTFGFGKGLLIPILALYFLDRELH
jgi:hypothetical protein